MAHVLTVLLCVVVLEMVAGFRPDNQQTLVKEIDTLFKLFEHKQDPLAVRTAMLCDR